MFVSTDFVIMCEKKNVKMRTFSADFRCQIHTTENLAKIYHFNYFLFRNDEENASLEKKSLTKALCISSH